ncbi:hypothetical protein H8744_16185 [Oscillospiraceae bacterium N12]|jgi:hypothetical protein|uniref:Uncharacterized protein n=1 Tax=Jilunia laotingensis TaxID=2763675 RepID=A0A926IQV7_9BACT|nr:hypothetical protein [Jilunia laotingensis]MBC8594749.1 hypothetical protein [Jilunia laotingensis]
MKKEFTTLMLILIGLTGVKAQDVQLVTLQKGEETQVFYGADAFIEAMAAADHGNTITLTAGTFNATNITKAVTIYGAGYETNVDKEKLAEEPEKYPTRINGNFDIALDSIEGRPAEGLYIEGIYSNKTITVQNKLVAASFIKCRFGFFKFGNVSDGGTKSEDCSFIHCRIADRFFPGESKSMSIINSIINAFLGTYNERSTIMIQNNIIIGLADKLEGGVLKNNIIGDVYFQDLENFTGDYYHSLSNYPVYTNIATFHNLFGNKRALDSVITKDGNWIDTNWATILFGESGIKEYSDTYSYQLTEEAKKTYLGTDGTEIGIYGGETPFSPILTIPRIIKKEIAPKTENGKLKVNIKVEIGNNFL